MIMDLAFGIGFGLVGLIFALIGAVFVYASVKDFNNGRPGTARTLTTGIVLLVFAAGIVFVATIGPDRTFEMLGRQRLERWLPTAGMCVGALVALLGVRLIARGVASRSWPTAEGSVLGAAVEREPASVGPGGRAYHLFSPAVEYEYEVRGERYSCSTVSAADMSTTNAARAERIAERYAPGSRVTVYYNPRRPGQAVLEPGAAAGAWLPLLVGAGMFAISAVLDRVFNP